MHALRFAFALLLGVLMVSGPGCAREPRSRSSSDIRQQSKPTTTPAPRVVDYAPGIRIDYRVPHVEIDTEVILREGSLELFLYSKAPIPKEHESILRTHAPASRIYEALGLIGLSPGQTMRYDPDTGKSRQPAGDPVEVRVRYERDGRGIEEPAYEWMINAARKLPMSPTHWLFCGSERIDDGRLAADEEGTVITVVDFPSSLLGLPALHSSSDHELWLKAATERIPPLGTKAVVILRRASSP